jgi:hypothetical protein
MIIVSCLPRSGFGDAASEREPSQIIKGNCGSINDWPGIVCTGFYSFVFFWQYSNHYYLLLKTWGSCTATISGLPVRKLQLFLCPVVSWGGETETDGATRPGPNKPIRHGPVTEGAPWIRSDWGFVHRPLRRWEIETSGQTMPPLPFATRILHERHAAMERGDGSVQCTRCPKYKNKWIHLCRKVL